jgi:hypothetical protein
MSIAATAATPAWRTAGQTQSAELTERSGPAASTAGAPRAMETDAWRLLWAKS